MKKILLFLSLTFLFFTQGFSQCSPNFIYTSLGFPGVYPPEIEIPNFPLPLGIVDGNIGSNYGQTLTLVVLEDTLLDVGFLLSTTVVDAMNLAGISTTMTADINHVTFDVQGLPNGISSQCNISTCQYPSAVDGCIRLSGIPTVAGTFSVPVNMTINIQVPAIIVPIAGTVLFPSTAFDIPQFAATTYDLFIGGATAIQNVAYLTTIYPNPTNSNFTIEIESPKQITIFNSVGQKVFSKHTQKNLVIDKSALSAGIFTGPPRWVECAGSGVPRPAGDELIRPV